MSWLIIVSGNRLSPVRHQAITWTNAGLLLTDYLDQLNQCWLIVNWLPEPIEPMLAYC